MVDQLTTTHGAEVTRSEQLQSLMINTWVDKARARGARTGVTVVAARIAVPFQSLPHSIHCAEFLSYAECDDCNEDLQTFAQPTLTELNSIFKSGSVTIDGKVLPVEPTSSADGAAHNSNYCKSSFLSTFSCPFCCIELNDCMEYNVEFLSTIRQRTLTSIRRNTHRQSSGTEKCSGCDLWVCDTQDEVEEKGGSRHAIRVCRGDATDPPIPWKSKTKTITMDGQRTKVTRTWEQWHFSVVYGQEVVWHIEPANAMICTLHWELQTTPLLIQGLVARPPGSELG